MKTPLNVIIDCDPGCDDAIAILIALSFPDKFNVVAITVVDGNVDVDQCFSNASFLLEKFKAIFPHRKMPPIYRGSTPLLKGTNQQHSGFLWPGHGQTGLGNFKVSAENSPKDFQPCAALEICRLVNETFDSFQKQQTSQPITLIAIGPLSNIALALKIDASIAKKVHKVFIMGGSYLCKGNISLCGEFNFFHDPEAAACVLDSFTSNQLKIIPWETCIDAKLQWKDYDEIVDMSSPNCNREMVALMKNILANYEKHCRNREGDENCFICCDAYCLAVMFDESISLKETCFKAVVDTSVPGSLSRGALFIDWYHKNGSSKNMVVVEKIDVQKFKELLLALKYLPKH
eukprot:Sdes_comp20801_c0_seq6m17114